METLEDTIAAIHASVLVLHDKAGSQSLHILHPLQPLIRETSHRRELLSSQLEYSNLWAWHADSLLE